MEKKKQRKVLIIGITLISIVSVILILLREKTLSINILENIQKTVQKDQQETVGNDTIPNCTTDSELSTSFPRNDKLVKLSDSKLSLSFKVPDDWIVETRHSGEKQLTVEEMRDFLATNYDGDLKSNQKLFGDYLDISWSDLRKMSPEEIRNAYNRSDNPWLPFPNASVAAGEHIWYNDTSWKQIDFYSIYDFDSKRTMFNEILALKTGGERKGEWCRDKIDGLMTDVVTFPTDHDESGNEVISKGGSGGKIYFVGLNDGKDMLIINKQAKGDGQFEKDFFNLMKSLHFSN